GRIHYTMGKNEKSGSLKIPAPALTILEEYIRNKRDQDDVIFPELKKIENFDDSFAVKRQITYGIKKANKYLKKITKRVGITKKLTMHIARHTFASMSGDKIPLQILQRLYRHSDITTTI